jgi:subtilisin family serine protease
MTIKGQLDTQGHARVMVALRPNKKRSLEGGFMVSLSETIDLQQQVAKDLSKHFKRFANSRAALLGKDFEAFLVKHKQTREVAVEAGAEGVPPSPKVTYFPNLGVMLGTVDEAGLAALKADRKRVGKVVASPDFSLIPPVTESALAGPAPGVSWALSRLKIPALWEKGLHGEGVLIGHLDTGVDPTHPALAGKIDAFAEFDFLGQRMTNSITRDTRYHGSHTAGLLVGAPVGGVTFGVAPGAKLASSIVIEGGDIPARVLGGLDWCVGQGVRVVNLSLGLPGHDDEFSVILTLLRQRNILPVVAIGNEGPQTSRSPGNLPESLSVGAFDELDEIWLSSSSEQMAGPPARTAPVLIAPGVGLFSSVPGGGLRALSGTSMATPHIAGLAALLVQYRPDLPIQKIEEAIIASCKRPSAISSLRGNHGAPDALEAYGRL